MAEKPSKIGFKIKLSSETSEKLKEASQSATIVELPPESASGFSKDNSAIPPLKNVSNTPESLNDTQKSVKSVVEKNDTLSPNITDETDQNLVTIEQKLLKDDTSAEVPSLIDDGNKLVSSEPIDTSDDSQKNKEKNSQNPTDNYAEHIHYEGEVAIYTDPLTKHEFIWSTSQNEWILRNKELETSESEFKDGESAPNTSDSGSHGFENNTHTYTDKDGSVYIWDEGKKAWFPKVDDDFLAQYQMAYGFVDNKTPEKEEETKTEDEPKGEKRKGPPEPPKWFDVSEDQNTNVYISNLPLDITEEEFVDFMQKCGLVMRDPTTQKMKIKLYTKPNSKQLKGDALCTYIKIESVQLALSILDGATIRNHRIQVQKAQFQMKGDYDPTLKPKKKRRKDKEKIKKMQEKLFDWRPEKFRGERSKHEKVVIIKNVFEPSLFDTDVQLILEFQQDLREECAKCGEVKKVVIYDRHPEGVAQVSMKEPEDADNVVKLIDGRWFGKRQLKAEIWDGKTKYKMEETDADLNKRLGNWTNFLEDPETKKQREIDEKKSTETETVEIVPEV